MKYIRRSDIGGGVNLGVHVCSVVNSKGPNSIAYPCIPTCDWVDQEGPCAFWNFANATLSNTIIVMSIYSTVVDFLNMFIYVPDKGFGAENPIVG